MRRPPTSTSAFEFRMLNTHAGQVYFIRSRHVVAWASCLTERRHRCVGKVFARLVLSKSPYPSTAHFRSQSVVSLIISFRHCDITARHRLLEDVAMKISALVWLVSTLTVLTAPVLAQQTTGVPGSPDATT